MGLPLKGLRKKVLQFLGQIQDNFRHKFKDKKYYTFKKEKLKRSKTLHNDENTK